MTATETATTPKLRRWRCAICSHVYDPAEGDPETNIPAGTPFESLPADWRCPDCGAAKDDFEPMAE
jgi:rubredoxin